jgi:hypothetical protein
MTFSVPWANALQVIGGKNQAFFTNSDFSFIAPMPSILQSIS